MSFFDAESQSSLDYMPAVARATVIVPARNAARELQNCLRSLRASIGINPEIIVIDDGSIDDTAKTAADCGADLVIRLPESRGPAVARNIGARRASHDVLVFIDADVQVFPATVAQLVADAQSEHYAAVFGSYCEWPTAPGIVSHFRNLLHHIFHQNGSQEAETFWAGCGAIRRDVFLAQEGFSEAYSTPCIEDIELGMRIRQCGHRIRLNPEIRATHAKRWTLRSTITTDVLRRGLPWSQLLLETRTLPTTLNLGWTQRISVLLTGFLLVLMLAMAWVWPFAAKVPVGLLVMIQLADFLSMTISMKLGTRLLAAGLVGTAVYIGFSFPLYLYLCGGVVVSILLLNMHILYRFYRLRGPSFAICAFPLFGIYLCCCGFSALAAIVIHSFKKVLRMA